MKHTKQHNLIWLAPNDSSLALDNLAPSLKEVLLASGSLTKFTKQIQGKEWTVDLLENGWKKAQPDEAAILHSDPTHSLYSRTVLLNYDNEPWMYATSSVTQSDLDGTFKPLLTLGKQPLGKWLFTLPNLTRSPFEITQVPNDHEIFNRIENVINKTITDPLWARRSLFTVSDQQLLLTEFFLPAMVRLLA